MLRHAREKTSHLFTLTSFINKPRYQGRHDILPGKLPRGAPERNWHARRDPQAEVLARRTCRGEGRQG